jgi:hypothetical protein
LRHGTLNCPMIVRGNLPVHTGHHCKGADETTPLRTVRLQDITLRYRNRPGKGEYCYEEYYYLNPAVS